MAKKEAKDGAEPKKAAKSAARPPKDAEVSAKGKSKKGARGEAQPKKGARGGAQPKKGRKAPAKEPRVPAEPVPTPRMKEQYEQEVVARLMKRFSYTNKHQVPRFTKIVLNMGAGDALQNIRYLEAACEDLAVISGQKASVRRAKKAIAAFKLRAGNPIGAMVTMRGLRMYEFLDRMISVAIPRIRDFRGLPPKGFDGRGNYSFGIKEQIIFPEIRYDKVEKIRGMDVTIVTTANTDEEGFELLKAMRMPFRER
jgi:large subunit ribosomal protein L5